MPAILYVDDEPALLEIGKLFLERTGEFTVDTAISAKEALQRMESSSYDCIVSDFQMPEMDGLEFLARVRETRGSLPFILFTGRGREEVAIRALNSGADFYLQKGGDPRAQFTELAHKIRLAGERNRLRDQVLDSERRLTDIINFLPDPTFAIDRKGVVIAWNQAIENLTGVRKERVIGTGDYSYALHVFGERRPLLLDAVLHDDPSVLDGYTQIVREGNRIFAERYYGDLPGGRAAYLSLVASPLLDAEGNITGAIESMRDVTRRREAENELRAAFEQLSAAEEELRQQYADLARSEAVIRNNERMLTDIINFLPDATFAIDREGVVIAWNRAMEEMTGIPGSAIIGTGEYSYSVPIWQTRRPILIDMVLRDDTGVEKYYPSLVRNDGKLVAEEYAPGLFGGRGAYVWFTASPFFDSDGEIAGAVESIRDITERVLAHNDLVKAYEDLASTGEELREQIARLTWSESRLREDDRLIIDLFSRSRDGVAILDRDLRIIRVNGAMNRLIPGSSGAVGKRCHEVFHDHHIPGDQCPAVHAVRTGFPDHVTVSRTKDGSIPGELDVYSYPLYDPRAGEISGVILYVRDRSALPEDPG